MLDNILILSQPLFYNYTIIPKIFPPHIQGLNVVLPSFLSALFRYDPDSGHDSGAEDAQDCPPPFCFLTMGMGKILMPKSGASNGMSGPLTAPLPPRLGVCLDFDKGRITFYDAHSLRVLWDGTVDCSAPVCPAFCFIGGGALQLQELIANHSTEQAPPRRVTIQSHATNLSN